MRKTDKDLISIIIENKNISSYELSKTINVPASTIRRIWEDNGIYKKQNFKPDSDEFIRMYDELKGSRKLAIYYNVDKATILNYAHSIGYNSAQFKSVPLLTLEDTASVVDSYHITTMSKLSNKFNCSMSLIGKVWGAYGCRDKGFARRYYCNFNYFKTIDSFDKAYFIGLIASDGCVYDRKNGLNQKLLSIALHQKDEDILKKFLIYIKGENPILHIQHDSTPMASLQLVSDIMCDDLSVYNIVPNKTWTYEPCNIPYEYLWHFLRGYFDGDGSISWNNNMILCRCAISFCGNKKTMLYIKTFLEDNKIKSCMTKDKRSIDNEFYGVSITNMQGKISFINKLYENSENLYLNRKRTRCDDFIEKCRSKGYPINIECGHGSTGTK